MIRSMYPGKSPATWGVMINRGAAHSGLSAGSGSVSKTSRPAPGRRPAGHLDADRPEAEDPHRASRQHRAPQFVVYPPARGLAVAGLPEPPRVRQDESEDVIRDRIAVDVIVGHPDVGAGHILAEVLDPGPERL